MLSGRGSPTYGHFVLLSHLSGLELGEVRLEQLVEVVQLGLVVRHCPQVRSDVGTSSNRLEVRLL